MKALPKIWPNGCSVVFVPQSEGKLAEIEVNVDSENKDLKSSVTEK
jgi:hypothetical protein